MLGKTAKEKWKTSFIGRVGEAGRRNSYVWTIPLLPVNIFCKSAHCPASETLLAYRKSSVARGEKTLVELHLAVCEFCSAELQLLDRYRYGAEEIVLTQMPAALRKLAEELLPNRAMRANSTAEFAETHHLSN
jgi:hypothetical protein